HRTPLLYNMDWPYPLYYTYHHGVDSWVEISSQPSSSSLSSVADEVVTSSLRIQHDPNTRRRRRLRPTAPTHLNITTSRPSSTGGSSSQEEYEESESESDRVMTSSGEGLPPSRSYARSPPSMGSAAPSSASEDGVSSAGLASGDEDDERNTAVNFPISTTTTTATTEQCFTPQPNAFSHPPTSHSSHRHASQPVPGSYFPASPRPMIARPATQRHSYPTQQTQARQQHTPYSHISSGVADHDAALRASLSTLLSCAAAARGLPKTRTGMTTPAHGPSARVDPASLRLVPESVALGEAPLEPVFEPTIRRTSTTSSGVNSLDKHPSKRKAATSTSNNTNAHGRGASKDRRAVKKARRSHSSGTDDANSINSGVLSPTLLTWVVSAGVVVLVSALSFTAGFAVGREVGRGEVELLGGGEMGGCAGEVGRTGGLGFRRLKLEVGRAVRV
ncbi:hypothetical protein LTR60_003565, partial [Cryomyces antarcticus]